MTCIYPVRDGMTSLIRVANIDGTTTDILHNHITDGNYLNIALQMPTEISADIVYAVIDGVKDSVTNYLTTLKHDLGDLGDDVIDLKALVPSVAYATTSKAIMQVSSLPTPVASFVDTVVLYNNIFYKCMDESVYTSTVSFTDKITCTGTAFTSFIRGIAPADFTSIVNGTMVYIADAELWKFTGLNAAGETVIEYQMYQEDFENAGFVFTGSFEDQEEIGFECEVTADYQFAWRVVGTGYDSSKTQTLKHVQGVLTWIDD